MAHEIHKVRIRKALEPRREPYWGPGIAGDLALGFRKIDAERGSWIVRMRNDAPSPRYLYKSLGLVTDANDHEKARAAALAWREGRDAGVSSESATIADACREYVADRRREKGERTAHDAEMRFRRTVYNTPFGALPLAKLRTPRLKQWRDDLELGKASANRTLTTLKAALNLAVTHRRVHPAGQREWADVKPHKAAGRRRDLFLDLGQRRALLNAAQGSARDLMEAAALTGARAGELVNALRSQFDARTGSMTFDGKTGRRTVPLSPAALGLFTRLAKSKLPSANLFVRDDGRPWAHSDWDELVRAAAKAADLTPGTCLYTLRHSFITQALVDGMPTLEVARLVGTSVAMIEKHYGHLVASSARERLATVRML
jgi:integrase